MAPRIHMHVVHVRVLQKQQHSENECAYLSKGVPKCTTTNHLHIAQQVYVVGSGRKYCQPNAFRPHVQRAAEVPNCSRSSRKKPEVFLIYHQYHFCFSSTIKVPPQPLCLHGIGCLSVKYLRPASKLLRKVRLRHRLHVAHKPPFFQAIFMPYSALTGMLASALHKEGCVRICMT